MPLFVLVCTDKSDALPVRLANREAHLAYLDADPSKVKLAGPRLNAAGEMVGSVVIVDVEDLDAAKAFAAGDPYAKAGLFESVTVDGYRAARGQLG